MMKNWMNNFLKSYSKFAYKNPLKILSGIFFITIISLLFASKLQIKTDFFELLPEKAESIVELHKILKRIGGTGNLILAIETKNFDATKLFVETIAKELKKLQPKDIKYIDYRLEDIQKFYNEHGLLFFEKEDLVKIKNRIQKKIAYEKKMKSPFMIFKKELASNPVELDFEDIKKKYDDVKGKITYKEGYLTGYKDSLFVIFIKPNGTSAGVVAAKALIGKVKNILKKHPPESYDKSIKVHFAGNFQTISEEYDVIIQDVVSTILLITLLVGLVIFLFFRKISPLFVLLFTLGFSVIWTAAIAYFGIGYLNSQTIFMTSLIIGTGVNYGIIYLARYYEELSSKRKHIDALQTASVATVSQTFLAAATTASVFLVLLFADNRGFSQFGFVGSIGIMMTWINTILFIPIFLSLRNKYFSKLSVPSTLFKKKKNTNFSEKSVQFSYKYAKYIFPVMLVVSGFLFLNFLPNILETDLRKLRNITSEKRGTAYWDKRVGDLFNTSLTPAIIIAKDAKEAEEICSTIDAKKAKLPEKFKKITTCNNLVRLIPKNQTKRLKVIQEIRDILYSKSLNVLNDEDYDNLVELRKKIKLEHIALKDIPYNLRKHFMDIDGNDGVLVVLNPRMELAIQENLTVFANLIRSNELKNGKVVKSSGESVIFADLLDSISKDGPVVTGLAFLSVLLLIILVLKSFKGALVIGGTLITGVFIMLGTISVLEIKLNFFNFIAFPLTFGIAVDYGINVFVRYLENKSIINAIKTTGKAVLLCSLTTILSYITLIIAKSQALASFGKIALIGEFASITAVFLLMPVLIKFLYNKKQ